MYQLKPTHVYALDTALETPDGPERMGRILKTVGIAESEVTVFSRAEAYDVCRAIQERHGKDLDPATPPQHQRPLVFTKIICGRNGETDPLLAERPEDVSEGILTPILGYITLTRDTHSPEADEERNLVCWNTQDLGVMVGCSHGCHYCGQGKSGKAIVLGVNINEYLEKVVGPIIEKHPSQKCFRMIGWGADIATFEPEYGVFADFLAKLAGYDDHYGYFHTAGDNVDWVENVPHKDRLIGVWSITGETVARLLEPASPGTAARVEAVRKCQSWGLPVRLKFKPMIPVRDWRRDYANAIKLILEKTQPESIGFCVLMWMDLPEVAKRIDLGLLDPAYVAAAEKAADAMKGVRTGPFPPEVRAEIYRFLIAEVRRYAPDMPVYLSTESREMWEELEEEIGQDPRTFVCGCNPILAPGLKLLASQELCTSTYFPSR